jgi:hypothetical protein
MSLLNDFFDKIGWHPGIGDPSFVGWFIVFFYFCTAILAFKVYRRCDRLFHSDLNRQKSLWLVAAIILCALCVNKQLDLQSFITASARYYLRLLDLYELKRQIQVIFILTILGIGVVCALTLAVLFRSHFRAQGLVIAGLVFLMAFVAIRASSFHNMDALIRFRVLGISMNWIFEISGIALIAINASRLLKRTKKVA